ncbi:Disease resistance-like protein DSC1 [Linum perenne]
MAASSSSPASSMSLLPPSSPPSSHTSSYTGEWEYDVFLCFRGDTRFGFTSHLMKALTDKQIKTFIDNKLEKTESIDELISILQRSALSVVVFSKKFADSVWCLDEVILLGDVIMNPAELFAPGSRIIVTTRDKRVLDYAKAMIYNVAGLNDIESIELFSLRAFRQHQPPHDWVDLSRLAASYCRGNPLALTILGGTLFGQDQHYWRSFLSELKLTQNPNVRDILRKSYDKLGAEEKKIFLDVACLLHGISRSRLIGYMVTMHPSAFAKVKDLIDRSLLTCVSGENIEVHDLLKEMAWNIVNEESKLQKRSRLVDPDDIHKLLTTLEVKYWPTLLLNPFKAVDTFLRRRKKRKVVDMDWKGYNPLEEHRTTEGISLELYKAKKMYLEADAFDGMNSLTFLKIWSHSVLNNKIHLPYGGLNSLPDGLRFLQWDGYPAKSLPSKFRPQYLVHLIIHESPIRRCWEGYDQPQLVNLMVLDLSRCRNLIDIPDISRSSNLEELRLSKCESLVEVPSHVQYLTKLITLDLRDCINLKLLPPKLDSKSLVSIPSGIHKLPKLSDLCLKGCVSIRSLPSSIYKLSKLSSLSLKGCVSIRSLPELPPNLKELDVSGCKSLQALPSNTSPTVRCCSAERLNKTAVSGKKNTLQEDEERKQKTSQNQAREASVRMIKHRSDAYADDLERVHDGGNLW